MPLTVTGENYRDFSEPRFFECTVEAEVKQIRQPVNKAHALVGPADGSLALALWKFDATSTAAASSTVLVPNNPVYSTRGRWVSIPVGTASGNAGTFAGAGSPEGVQLGSPGNTYWDTANRVLYIKNTGTATNTGWLSILTL